MKNLRAFDQHTLWQWHIHRDTQDFCQTTRIIRLVLEPRYIEQRYESILEAGKW